MVKRVLIVLLLAIGTGIVGLVLVLNVYPQLGRISFTAVKDEINIPGTNYVLTNGTRSAPFEPPPYYLKNNRTQQQVELGDIAEFAIIKVVNRRYLLTKIVSSGSAGYYFYNVFNISGETSHELDLNSAGLGLMAGASCANPKLEGDFLEFEITSSCKFFPFTGGEIQTYQVRLD